MHAYIEKRKLGRKYSKHNVPRDCFMIAEFLLCLFGFGFISLFIFCCVYVCGHILFIRERQQERPITLTSLTGSGLNQNHSPSWNLSRARPPSATTLIKSPSGFELCCLPQVAPWDFTNWGPHPAIPQSPLTQASTGEVPSSKAPCS